MRYSKNTFIISKALVLLEIARANPKKHASTKETFIVRIATILEMVALDFNVSNFYSKHLDMHGLMYMDLFSEVDDDWAYQVIDDAIEEINLID